LNASPFLTSFQPFVWLAGSQVSLMSSWVLVEFRLGNGLSFGLSTTKW
jgi:hypothetical protein